MKSLSNVDDDKYFPAEFLYSKIKENIHRYINPLKEADKKIG